MPRYLTNEAMYHCDGCQLNCAIRELKRYDYSNSTRSCPRCDLETVAMQQTDGRTRYMTSQTMRALRQLWPDTEWQNI